LENVRDFQHEAGTRGSDLCHQAVEDGLKFGGAGSGQVSVKGGCVRTLVSQDFLDDAQVDARFEQMGGVGMAQGMNATVLGHAGIAKGGFEGLVESVAGQGSGAFAVGEEPGGGGSLNAPVVSKLSKAGLGQGNGAVAPPFAVANPEQAALSVDVAGAQPHPLEAAQTAGVDHPKTHAGNGLANGFEHLADFVGAEDDRQPHSFPGSDEIEHRPLPPQRLGEEKLDRMKMRSKSPVGRLLYFDEIKEEPADILLGDAGRRQVAALHQIGDTPDIMLSGAFGKTGQPQVVEHSISESFHRASPFDPGFGPRKSRG